MNWNRPLIPNFLKKIDQKLLLNKPEIWSTRTHLVTYYGLLFILVLGGICFVYPNDARSDSDVVYWIFFTSIVALLSVVVWLIYLLRFNVFKRFGNVTGLNRLKVFWLYFLSIAIIVFFAYIPPIVESIRANHKYKDEEIIRDINRYNVLWNILEYDSVDHNWDVDTIRLTRNDSLLYANDDLNLINSGFTVFNKKYIDTLSLKNEDSVIKLSSHFYKRYTCPTYVHLDVYRSTIHYNGELSPYSNRDIYNNTIANFKKPDLFKVKDEMNGLIKKYFYEHQKHDRYYYENDYTDRVTTYEYRVNKRYFKNNVDKSISNICSRKYCFSGNAYEWQLRIIFYVSLVLTLLLFTFRHSTTKTFFLSILTAIILSILTAMIMAFLRYNGNQFFYLMIAYITLFGIVASTILTNKTRNAITGIALNMFVWLIYCLPLYITSIINSYIKEKLEAERLINPKIQIDYTQFDRNLVIAEFVGLVILLILLPTFIHKLYKRWFALPEE